MSTENLAKKNETSAKIVGGAALATLLVGALARYGDILFDGEEPLNQEENPDKEYSDLEDTDGDGLSDALEFFYDSDIYNPDTDGDGLVDTLEYFNIDQMAKLYDEFHDDQLISLKTVDQKLGGRFIPLNSDGGRYANFEDTNSDTKGLVGINDGDEFKRLTGIDPTGKTASYLFNNTVGEIEEILLEDHTYWTRAELAEKMDISMYDARQIFDNYLNANDIEQRRILVETGFDNKLKDGIPDWASNK